MGHSHRWTALIVVAMIIVLASGCLGFSSATETPEQTPSKPWAVDAYVDDVDPHDNWTLEGTVAPGGLGKGNYLSVTVVLLNEEKEILKEIHIGNITDGERYQFNTSVPERPRYATIRIDEFGVPQPEAGIIEGKYIAADGTTELYTVEDISNYSKDG